jgi:dTDP-4-amino-4,6-dideoxygalactose transaminase
MAQAMLPSDRLPAILGGPPAFPEGLPLVRPSLPDAEVLANDLRRILDSRTLTNGPYVRELEDRAAEYLGVRHCVAVASCTAGLMLVIRASELSGDVIVPSFTFAATAHAVAWNGLRPVFADIDAETLTLSPRAVRRAVGVRTSAILATHVFGTPCDVEGLAAAALEHGIRLFFDAAHAFGSRRQGKPVGGFGHAEVFSLSPTKVMVAGEGGIIATNDDVLAERCRIGRDYGNPGNYDCLFVGLNARLSEIHAALGLRSLEGLEERLQVRNRLARAYQAALAEVPGISFPQVPEGSRSTFKDFTILVDLDGFGLDAAQLGQALAAEGVETRRYYAPPVHTMRAYRYLNGRNGHLPVTEQISARVLTLPLWSDMTESHLLRVAEAISEIHLAAPRENFPPEVGEKIRRPQDGGAGPRAYGERGSEGGPDV